MEKMYFAEFMGLPGSGKTTLRSSLFKKFSSDNIISSEYAIYQTIKKSCDDRLLLLFVKYLPWCLAKNGLNAFFSRSIDMQRAMIDFLYDNEFLIKTIMSDTPFKQFDQNEKLTASIFFLLSAGNYQLIKKKYNNKKLVIFDEGFIQKSMTVLTHSSMRKPPVLDDEIKTYIDCVPLPNFVIFVDCDPDIAIKRMKSRNSGITKRFRHKSSSEIIQFVEIAYDLFQNVTNLLKENNVKVIRVKSDFDIEQNSKKIFTDLSSYQKI